MAWVGLWPIIVAPQGDSSSVSGSVASAAAVSGQGVAAFVANGAITAASTVEGVNGQSQGWSFGLWPVLGLVNGMGLQVGAVSAGAVVSGQARASNVQTASLTAGATVAGYDSSAGTGVAGLVGLWPFLALQGSTTVLPWGAVLAVSSVAGEGVYSVMGDYATPPRSVFDLPPPVDFKIPGLFLEYGGPVSLRPAGAVQGDVTAYSSASGQLVAAIARAAEVAAAAQVTGELRARVVRTSELVAGAQVTGVAVGVTVTVMTAHIVAAATVTGVDRSLAPGVGLGIVEASSAVAGEARLENAQTPEVDASSRVHGVDASFYPLAAAPAGAVSSGATVSGEAIAQIVRRAELEAQAVIAAVSTTVALAEAAVYSMAMVRGTTVTVGGPVVGVGRRRIGSLYPVAVGARVGSATVSADRARIGTKKP